MLFTHGYQHTAKQSDQTVTLHKRLILFQKSYKVISFIYFQHAPVFRTSQNIS